MTARFNPLIGKLLPRLASCHAGEVVATARAIERLLRASGHDWHDLAAAIAAPPVAKTISSTTARPGALDWHLMTRQCLSRACALTPRDYEFLTSIAFFRTLSPKQAKWLTDIHRRVVRAAA
jgi:hypothetical protein